MFSLFTFKIVEGAVASRLSSSPGQGHCVVILKGHCHGILE